MFNQLFLKLFLYFQEQIPYKNLGCEVFVFVILILFCCFFYIYIYHSRGYTINKTIKQFKRCLMTQSLYFTVVVYCKGFIDKEQRS